jgi:ketosteroid isomerase-like protein
MRLRLFSRVLDVALCSALLFAPVAARAQTSADTVQTQVFAKEREGLEALKSGNLDAFGALTADDAVFVDAQGTATKADVMKNVQGFRLVDFSMKAQKFVLIAPAAGLISYTLTETGTSHGKTFTATAYISSVWVQRAGKWVCVFSQETGAK